MTRTHSRSAGLALAAALLSLAAAPAARADDPAPVPGQPAAPPAKPPPSGRFIDTYDANGDGRVMKAEFTGDGELFDLLDSDKDGCVVPQELGLPADYKTDPNWRKKEEPPGGGGRDRWAGAAERIERMKRQFAEWDTDKDGKVTKEEYKGKGSFEVLDRNKDGVLSADDVAAFPGAGKAPRNPAEAQARFKEQDKNGDGKVTPDEFPGPAEVFKARDANGDGALTLDEVEKAGMEPRPGAGRKERFARMDADKDGKLSPTEFLGGAEMFKAMDKDADGFLTPEELDTIRGKGKKPGDPAKPGGPAAPGTPAPPMDGGDDMGPAAPGGAPMGGLFAALDKNRDGKLSREEFAGNDEEWRRLDRDANGWITPEEAAAK
jgi:Ca2+-binding EF-hand superfamily protein